MPDIKTLSDIRDLRAKQVKSEEVLSTITTVTGESTKVVFNPDGSITKTKLNGSDVLYLEVTTFPTESTIVKTITIGAKVITKTTTFNPDGSISEVVS